MIPQIAIWLLLALFPKGRSEDRQAPQSRYLQIARGCGKAERQVQYFKRH